MFRLLAVVDRYKVNVGALFQLWSPSRTRTPGRSEHRCGILKQVTARKGLSPEKYHSHMLRHCFSTHCHDNGMPIEVVSKLLGHVNLSTTVRLHASVNRPH